MADLRDGQEVVRTVGCAARALRVDPSGRVRVAADLEVVLQLLGANCLVLSEELLDFVQDKRVALDSGRVVCLVDPDVFPDVLGFDRTRQPAKLAVQVVDLTREPFVDRCTFRSSAAGYRSLQVVTTSVD